MNNARNHQVFLRFQSPGLSDWNSCAEGQDDCQICSPVNQSSCLKSELVKWGRWAGSSPAFHYDSVMMTPTFHSIIQRLVLPDPYNVYPKASCADVRGITDRSELCLFGNGALLPSKSVCSSALFQESWQY